MIRPVLAVLAAFLFLSASHPAFAQTAGRLLIQSADGRPLPGSDVVLSGTTTVKRVTADDGTVDVSGLTGTFSVTVSHAGYTTRRSSISLPADLQDGTATLSLAANNLSSLTAIGTTSSVTTNAVNRTPAATTIVPAATFAEQGVTSVIPILDETPGVTVPRSASSAGIPNFFSLSIRGALPYESATFIDGHPTTSGYTGGLNLSLISPYLLQSAEVVRGPGAFADNLNNAIMGTVNFRLLEPTATASMKAVTTYDSLFGAGVALTATGSIGRLGYAVGYTFNGAPGPDPDHGGLMSLNTRFTINGASFTTTTTATPQPGYALSIANQYSAVFCCDQINQENQLRNELAKLSYTISPVTTISAGFWSSQFFLDQAGANDGQQSAIFAPGAGYSGSVSPGPFLNNEAGLTPYYSAVVSDLFETELDTKLGPGYFRARVFRSQTHSRNYRNMSAGYTVNGQLYGTITQGGVATTYNGQTVTIGLPVNKFNLDATDADRLNGVTAEYQVPIGEVSVTASYDSTLSSINYQEPINSTGTPIIIVPPGTSILADTYSIRASAPLGARGLITLGMYTDHYVNNIAPVLPTFQTTSSNYSFPRLGLSYSPWRAVSLRFSAGGSITPAPLDFIATTTTAPLPNNAVSPTSYSRSLNNLNLKPETSFGYDVGVDAVLDSATKVSADLYMSNVFGQFLNTAYQNGTYSGVPLYITQYINLGESIYEGVELTVRRRPEAGFGYVLQSDFLRNFTPKVTPSLYASAAGPNTTNLGLLPGVNFNNAPSSYSANGLALGFAVPYATGYGEINFRDQHGTLELLGATYYGSNNTFNLPAFAVLNAAIQHPFSSTVTANLSVDNLNNIHSSPYYGYFPDGIAVPLVNGLLSQTVANVMGPRTVRLTLTYKR